MKILVVSGPTASGKTALGVELAQLYNGEVVSADSMQIYRDMDIGTAKPSLEEMDGVPHYMLGVVDPGHDFSVSQYVEMASAHVDDILARGKLPIVVGGTGLYIDHLIAGREFATFTGQWREKLQQRADVEGLDVLHKELMEIDPDRGQKLFTNDGKRIIRALEVWYETGETITSHDTRTQAQPAKYDALRVNLTYQDRADLRARIATRVDMMMEMGLMAEVEALMKRGIPATSTAMQAIGYKEFSAVLNGQGTIEQAVAEVKLRSGQYAKRQLSWQRRYAEAKWILWDKVPDLSVARQKATDYMEEFGLL